MRIVNRCVSLLSACCLGLCSAAGSPTQRQPAAPGQLPSEPRREVVVVTGTFEPVPLEESDRAVDRVAWTADEHVLANTPVDVLQLLPWLDLRQRAPDNIQGDLSIRGGTFGQTVILLDGFRLNDVQTGHHNLDLPVPLSVLDRVEVLRGSGSTYYGSDAVGGVVNFVTRGPSTRLETRFQTGLGNFGRNQQRAVLGWRGRDGSELLCVDRNFSAGFMPNRDYRLLALCSRTELPRRFGGGRLILAHADRPFGADRFYGNFNSWERTRTWFAGFSQPLASRATVGVAFRRHTDLFVLYRDRPEVFTNRHRVASYQAYVRSWEPVARNARLQYGLEGLWEAIRSTNLGSHERARGAGFVGLDVRAIGRFSSTLGLRSEWYGPGRLELSPTVGGGFWLSSQWRLRASLSRSFRLPTYTDLYYHDPGNRGSPDLKPEQAWEYEAGVEWVPTTKVRGEVTVFERRERNGIDYVRFSPVDIWRATNIRRLRFRGLEAGAILQGRVHRLELRYASLAGHQEALGGVISKYVFNYPEHSGTLAWLVRWGNEWALRSRWSVVDRIGREPYAVWDVFIGRTRGRWRPYGRLTNLLNTRYEEIFGVPMPGRGILGGVEWNFSADAH